MMRDEDAFAALSQRGQIISTGGKLTAISADAAARRHTLASDDVSVLNRLIDHGLLAISLRKNPEPAMVSANLDLVCAAVARPSDGNRAVCHHTAMFASAVERCDAALARQDNQEAQIYSRVIGALFPDVRDDAMRALQNRMKVPY